MILNEIEIKRLSKISNKTFEEILRLNKDADRMWCIGDDSSRCIANSMYMQANEIYRKQVLFRKF